jgi:hypothetical protein
MPTHAWIAGFAVGMLRLAQSPLAVVDESGPRHWLVMAIAERRVIPGFSVMGSVGYGGCESDILQTFCGLAMTQKAETWLDYKAAAKRVKSSERTIRNWRQQGMPMEWAVGDAGQKYRVVEEQVLLSWWRQKMQNSPVHQYRMRRKLIEAGETPPPIRRPKRNAPEKGQEPTPGARSTPPQRPGVYLTRESLKAPQIPLQSFWRAFLSSRGRQSTRHS